MYTVRRKKIRTVTPDKDNEITPQDIVDAEHFGAESQAAADRQEQRDKEAADNGEKTSNCGGVPCTVTRRNSTVTPNTSPNHLPLEQRCLHDSSQCQGQGQIKEYKQGDFGKGDGGHDGGDGKGGHDGNGGKGGHEHDEHDDHHNHDNHDHHRHNNWCDHHDCHHHNHHTSTHFSDHHEGDVTVKVETKYKETNSKNLKDVHLVIGDVYEKVLDLSDKPDTIKVDNLDIDGGDDFAVCLANEDSDEGDCVVTHADNDHSTVKVNLTVK